ncbi:MAG: cytochrome c oxidase subunit II [Gemmatimonadota bacterium]|nr:cytochrome c oxidase subunit II [Gemmatimonadota bacterium]
MKIHVYEKAFLYLSVLVLVTFLAALAFATVGMGISLPSRADEIDPRAVRTTAPFDQPGVRRTGANSYEVVVLGQMWAFVPNEIRVPAGAEITFRATSADVLHGLAIEGTRVNLMLIPGQVTEYTYTFEQPGEYLLICHEYCGRAHHEMGGKVIVE